MKELKRRIDRINIYKAINEFKHGGHPQSMLTIYNSLITSVIMYGAPIYDKLSATCCKILEVTERKALRVATGCSKTTPINNLAGIAAQEPLIIKRDYVIKKFIVIQFERDNIVAKQLKINNIFEF